MSRRLLVLQPRYIDGYRVIQSVQDKAWVADNGCSLVKTHNAVLDALDCSRRASQKVVIHVVALFVKGRCTMPQASIPCKARLVANHFLTCCNCQYNGVGVLGLVIFFATLTGCTSSTDYPVPVRNNPVISDVGVPQESVQQRVARKKYILQHLKQEQKERALLLEEVQKKYAIKKAQRDRDKASQEAELQRLQKLYQNSLHHNQQLQRENASLLIKLQKNADEQRALKSKLSQLEKQQKRSSSSHGREGSDKQHEDLAASKAKAQRYQREIKALEQKRDELREQLRVMIEAY